MNKYIKVLFFCLLFVFSLQQAALVEANQKVQKPTEGIESTEPGHGSSKDVNTPSSKDTGLIYDYYCSIDDAGTYLYCEGATKAFNSSDRIKLTLYLQKWNGSQWVDVKSWSFSKTNAQSVIDGATYSKYQHGSYYRTKAVHYVKNDSQSEKINSTSSYIYVE